MTTKRPLPTDIQVGQSIRAHRLIAGMSQSKLAEQLGISFQQVQKYEKGVNRVGAGRLLQIATAFNIPVNALFETLMDTSAGKPRTTAAPAKFISDHGAVRLLASYTDITDRAVRRGVSQLVDVIAKSARKQSKRRNSKRAA